MGEYPTGPMRVEKLLALMSRYQSRENYRLLFRGVWVRRDHVVDFTTLSCAAALAYPGSDKDLPGIFARWSAADLWGNAYRPDTALPEVIVPINGRQFRGLHARRVQLDADEYTVVGDTRSRLASNRNRSWGASIPGKMLWPHSIRWSGDTPVCSTTSDRC